MPALDSHDEQPAKTETTYSVSVTKVVRNFPFRNREYKEVGKDENNETEYGYVYFDDSKKVETIVYEQELADISLPAIIKAVNGI